MLISFKKVAVLTAVAALLLFVAVVQAHDHVQGGPHEHGPGLGRGFGDQYHWYTIREGLKKIKETGRPGMVVLHKSWCGACKALGPKFAESAAVQAASKDFIMINVQDDDEPTGDQVAEYAPDGGYIPRILFVDPATQKVAPGVKVPNGNAKYGYYYSSPEQIVQGMQAAKAAFQGKEEL
jgi:protein-disulfide reductase (glutathione)